MARELQDLLSRKENLVKQPSALVPYTLPVRHRSSGDNGSVQSPTVAVYVLCDLLGHGETLAVNVAAKKRAVIAMFLCCMIRCMHCLSMQESTRYREDAMLSRLLPCVPRSHPMGDDDQWYCQPGPTAMHHS